MMTKWFFAHKEFQSSCLESEPLLSGFAFIIALLLRFSSRARALFPILLGYMQSSKSVVYILFINLIGQLYQLQGYARIYLGGISWFSEFGYGSMVARHGAICRTSKEDAVINYPGG